MRVSVAGTLPVLLLLLAVGCTPRIPIKEAFGTSTLEHAGDTPPEFAEFNVYDPRVNRLLAAQICATPSMQLAENSFPAAPGRIVQKEARCRTHVPILGP